MSGEPENKKQAAQAKSEGKAGVEPKKTDVSESKETVKVASKPKGQTSQPKKDAPKKTIAVKPDAEKVKEAVEEISSTLEKVEVEVKVSAPLSPVKKESESRSPVKTGNNDIARQVVLERGVFGKVSWFSNRKGFGFIERSDKKERIFVYSTAIAHGNNGFYGLDDGEDVEFDVVQGPKGLEAAAVTGPGGIAAGFRLRIPPVGRRIYANRTGRPSNPRNRRNTANVNDENNESHSEESSKSEYSSATEKSVEDRKDDAPKKASDGKQKVQAAPGKKQETKANQATQKPNKK